MCLVGQTSILKYLECSTYFYTSNQIPFRSLLSETDFNQFVGIYGRCNLLLLPTTIYLFSQLCLYISLFISTLCNLLYSLSHFGFDITKQGFENMQQCVNILYLNLNRMEGVLPISIISSEIYIGGEEINIIATKINSSIYRISKMFNNFTIIDKFYHFIAFHKS